MYAEICCMAHIPKYTIWTSLNNNFIIWHHATWIFNVVSLLYYLLWLFHACMIWVHDTWPGTHAIAYTCHLVSFCTYWVAFCQPWTCMFRSWSLNWGGPFSWGPDLPRRASGSAVVSFRLALLARFSLSTCEFLSFVSCIAYFWAPWWCNNYVILCHSLWWLSTCTFVLEYILSRTSVLWLLYCTDA